MNIPSLHALSLEEFLQHPHIDESPAWEYINGCGTQKPMPQGRHSKLQFKLCEAINQIGEPEKVAYAMPELRCTFAGRSLVPDIAVMLWTHLDLTEEGEIKDEFAIPPDWAIEILSPGQSANRVTANISHCLRHGCQLGWLIDPDGRSVLILQPGRSPDYRAGEDQLTVLSPLNLSLTVDQLFSWLKFPL